MGRALFVNPTVVLHCIHHLPLLQSTAPVLPSIAPVLPSTAPVLQSTARLLLSAAQKLSTSRLQQSTVLAVQDIVLLLLATPTNTARTTALLSIAPVLLSIVRLLQYTRPLLIPTSTARTTALQYTAPLLLSIVPLLQYTTHLRLAPISTTVIALLRYTHHRPIAPTSTARTVPLLFTLLQLRSIRLQPVPVGMEFTAVHRLPPLVAAPIQTTHTTEALEMEAAQEAEAMGMAKTPHSPLSLVVEKSPCGERLTISKRIIQTSSICYFSLSKAFRTSMKAKI